MYCYKVEDDCIVSRDIKKKIKDDKALGEYVGTISPGTNVYTLEGIKTTTATDLYSLCCELTPQAEDTEKYQWFVSMENSDVLALAILHVISKASLWKLLQDRDAFDEWVSKNVR